MGSALNWGRIRNMMEAKGNIETFAVDLLGHALNHPKDPAAYKNAHAALSQNLIEELEKIQPTHVVAHSFGFRPALIIGQKRPELIPHLIVEDSSPELTENAYSFLMSVMNAPVPFRTREEARDYLDKKYGHQSALSRFFLSNIRSRPDGMADWRFDKRFLEALLNESLDRSLWPEWEKFPGKADLVYGANSEGLPPALVQKMRASRKNIRVVAVEGSGHWVHSDQAEAFVEALVSLL